MRLEQANYTILEQKDGEYGVYEMAEYAGRICYHSQGKKTDTSAKSFCENLMKVKHGGPLEHGTVYLKVSDNATKNGMYSKYIVNPYSKIKFEIIGRKKILFITTNLRVLFENGWMDDLKYRCEYSENHERRISVQFYLDRFTGEEFLRHRHGSFCRESTRYVNYLKDKFGGGNISFILPPWMDGKTKPLTKQRYNEIGKLLSGTDTLWWKIKRWFGFTDVEDITDTEYWLYSLNTTEKAYNMLIGKYGWKPEQARTVLPCAIKSPLLITAFESDWIHFFNLRSDIAMTGKPHPQAEQLATPLRNEFIERGYINENQLFKH